MLDVNYPASIKTNYEKLCAVYSLIEQMRLEYNRQGAIARSNWDKYKDAWYIFARRPQNLGGNIFNKKLLPLLQEQNRLRAAIREKRFTNKEWKALSDEARDVARLEMYSDKTLERVKPTKATSILLDELKGVSLDNLTGEVPPDPTEDFTEFTEVDSDGDITITASKMDVDTMSKGADSYTYKSHGASHFGDFDHLLDVYTGNEGTEGYGNRAGCWAVVDNPGNYSDAKYTHHEGIYVWVVHPDASRIFTLIDYSNNEDDSGGISVNTKYYLTISRSNTTATCLIYTDSGRTNLHDTLSITCGTTAYEYVQGVCSQDQGSANEASYYIENLDLQEGGPTTYEISCSDGVALGESPSANLTINLSLSDGISSGDSPGSGLNIDLSLSDGITLSDALSISLTIGIALSEGLKLSDLNTANLLADIEVSEGINIGEQILAGILFDIASADGIKLSDSAQAVLAQLISASDGIVLSDNTSANIEINISAADGIELSEVISIICQFYLTISDVAKISDMPVITLETTQSGISVTMKLNDRNKITSLNPRSVTLKINSRNTTTESPYGRE